MFWFEPPLVAHWIPERNIWSTKDIHDIKYNEEKQTIAFRSGKLGVHGLVANRFANLPFQSWELKPEIGRNGREYAGVVLNVTAATIQAEFLVRVSSPRRSRVDFPRSFGLSFPCCFPSIAGGSSVSKFIHRRLVDAARTDTRRVRRTGHSDRGNVPSALSYRCSEITVIPARVFCPQRMQRIGCDLFPERDAASYLKGSPIKHPVAENHLRRCMALLSNSYVFSWSRWNATRTFWEIVLQFKEVHGCVAKEVTRLVRFGPVKPWNILFLHLGYTGLCSSGRT